MQCRGLAHKTARKKKKKTRAKYTKAQPFQDVIFATRIALDVATYISPTWSILAGDVPTWWTFPVNAHCVPWRQRGPMSSQPHSNDLTVRPDLLAIFLQVWHSVNQLCSLKTDFSSY